MFDINMFGRKRGINSASFQGEMHCPFCSTHVDNTTTPIGFESDRQKIRLLGNVGPLMREYKCMKCGGVWRYDLNARKVHPYSSFQRGLKDNPLLNTIQGMSFKKHKIS